MVLPAEKNPKNSIISIFKISQGMFEGWRRNGRSRRKNEKQEK